MPKIAVIIPCYNEHKRLNPATLTGFLSARPGLKMVLVNDGSTDDTRTLLNSLKEKFPAQVTIVTNAKRKGKAESVRLGLLESARDPDTIYHGYLDADLAVSLEEFERLSKILASNGNKFIFGSRIKKVGSLITRNEWRHFYSRFIATFVGYITRLDVYDTQCSAKIFHSELVPVIASEPFHTKWLFDVELIDRIRKKYNDLNSLGHEEPLLEWNEIKGSKLRWYNIFRILREMAILRKYCRKK